MRIFQRMHEIVLIRMYLTHNTSEGFQWSRGRAWPTGRQTWKSDQKSSRCDDELAGF